MCWANLAIPEQWGCRNNRAFGGFSPPKGLFRPFLGGIECLGIERRGEKRRLAAARLPFPAVSSVIEPVSGLLI